MSDDASARFAAGPPGGTGPGGLGPVEDPTRLPMVGDAYFIHLIDLKRLSRGYHHKPRHRTHWDMSAVNARMDWIRKPHTLRMWFYYWLWARPLMLIRNVPEPIMGGQWTPQSGTTSTSSASAGVGDYIVAWASNPPPNVTNAGVAYAINGRTGAVASSGTDFATVWNYVVAQFEATGPASTGATSAVVWGIATASLLTFYTTGGANAYPRQDVTVTGCSPAGYNLAAQIVANCQNLTYCNVAAGSNGVNVNTFAGAGTLNVSATQINATGPGNYANSGVIYLTRLGAVITYTGRTANTFTGCTTVNGVAGAMQTGDEVDQTWFSVASTANPSTFTTAGVYNFAATAGGQMTVVNLSLNNGRVPAKATLNTCDGLSVISAGAGKSGHGAPFEDTGSVVITAAATFTSSTTLVGAGAAWSDVAATAASDGKVLVDARGGDANPNSGGREDLSFYKIAFDGGGGESGTGAVVDCTFMAIGKGSGNAVIMYGCKITGAAATNVSIGSNQDTSGGGDIYWVACQVSWNATTGGTKGGTPQALVSIYCSDTTVNYCNIANPQGNTCSPIYISTGGRVAITDCHIGGSGNTSSRITLFGANHCLISRNYLDNDKSSTGSVLIKPSGGTNPGTGTCYLVQVTNNYFNSNAGATAMVGLDGSSSKNLDGTVVAFNQLNGVTTGGVSFAKFTGFSGGDTRAIRITDNHGKNIDGIYTGTCPSDSVIRRNGGISPNLSTGVASYQDTPSQLSAQTGAIANFEALVNSYIWYPGWMGPKDSLFIIAHGIDTFAAGATTTIKVGFADGSVTATIASGQTVDTTPRSVTVGANSLPAGPATALIPTAAGLQVLTYNGGGGTTTLTNCTVATASTTSTGTVYKLVTMSSVTTVADIATGGAVIEATVTMRSQTALYTICEYRLAKGVEIGATNSSVYIDAPTNTPTTLDNTKTNYIVVSAVRSAASGSINFRECLIAPGVNG